MEGVNAAGANSWGDQLMQDIADSSWKERLQMVSQAQRLMPQDQQRPAQYPGAPGLISPRAASVDLPSSGQAPAPGRPSSGGKGIVPGETREAALRRAAQQQVAFGQRGFGAYPSARFAEGGLTSLESGGFVVPADVVSAMGSGSTEAGLRALAPLGAEPIRGPGDGQSDDIPTTVDGRKPARVADGEAYLSPRAVAKLGGGDSAAGAKKLYAMMDRVRQQAHGHTKQQRPVNLKKAMA